MKRLVSTLNLTKEDWLRYRKCGITGTDAGAILGLNPYRSAFQVYHDKISDTVENIDNEAMRQGRDLENYVAQRFTETTGLKVRRANAIYQSEEHPLLLADFDRLIVGQKAGLECKTVSPFSADKWADGKIPAHYLAQVDHYLAVSGFDCWYVAALIFGKELVIHKIVTDKQVLSDLIDKEELFWTNHIVPQIPPAPNGCDCDTQQINQMYEVDNRDKTADLSALHGLLDKRQELSDQIEQMEQEKTAIEQQVKLKIHRIFSVSTIRFQHLGTIFASCCFGIQVKGLCMVLFRNIPVQIRVLAGYTGLGVDGVVKLLVSCIQRLIQLSQINRRFLR